MSAQEPTKFKEHIEHLIGFDGVKIPAVFCAPAETTSNRVLLLLHGITTDKNEYLGFLRTVAHRLAENGISSLRIDFRGHGESTVPADNFSIASQLLDIITSLEWLAKHGGNSKIDLLGCSFGAPPCLFATRLMPSIVRSIYLLAPVLDYWRTFIRPITPWASNLFNEESIKKCLEGGRI